MLADHERKIALFYFLITLIQPLPSGFFADTIRKYGRKQTAGTAN
jgi:hypothetical protein